MSFDCSVLLFRLSSSADCCLSLTLCVDTWLSRYVTEGQFRASHRSEPENSDPADVRLHATMPGVTCPAFPSAFSNFMPRSAT